MKFKVTCPECEKNVVVSTRSEGFARYVDATSGEESLSFDCPECDEEIEVIRTKTYKGN